MQLHRCGKTPGHGLTRQRHDLTEAPQAHAGKGAGRLRGEPYPVDGQLFKRSAGLVGALERQAIVAVGKHARRHRVARQDNPVAKPQSRQFGAQTCFECRPGAKQAQAGLDFQQQYPWVMQADLRTELVSPGGEQLLQGVDSRRVVVNAGEMPRQRLSRSQRLPGAQTEGRRRWVDGLQHAALRRAAEQRQRRVGIGAPAQHRVECQLRQQDTSPEHDPSASTGAGYRPHRRQATATFEHPPLARTGINGNAQRRR
ncbi:hypothetical protein D3C79_731010 [compost metagenome]